MRANFDYNPSNDPELPCRELGLKFALRDVLHVVFDDDDDWWQAFLVGKEAEQNLPGLVPSSAACYRRKWLRQRELFAQNAARITCRDALDSGGFFSFRNCFRRKKAVAPTGSPILLL